MNQIPELIDKALEKTGTVSALGKALGIPPAMVFLFVGLLQRVRVALRLNMGPCCPIPQPPSLRRVAIRHFGAPGLSLRK